MKKIKMFFGISITAILISCGTSKETTTTTQAPNRGSNNTEVVSSASKSVSSSRTASSAATASAEASKKKAEMEKETNRKRMYTDLNMTEDQVSRFEASWNNSVNAWKRNNRNSTMNNYERIEIQDKILRDILDDDQFESYQEWVRKQAGRN